MTNYQHILLATDFSDASRTAAGKARDLAQRCETRLSVIHVVDYTPPGYLTEYPVPRDHLINTARDYLDTWLQQVDLRPDTKWVEVGSPKKEIARAAQEQGVDLLVVGTRGEGALGRLLGSTTTGVLHSAPCDVLAVRGAPD